MPKTKQLVFIDDSGDPGFKFNKGSTQYFVIACIIFDTNADAESAGANIKKLKQKLNWKPEHEFKFNKNTYDQRIALLKAARKYNFKTQAVVVDKKKFEKTPKNGRRLLSIHPPRTTIPQRQPKIRKNLPRRQCRSKLPQPNSQLPAPST